MIRWLLLIVTLSLVAMNEDKKILISLDNDKSISEILAGEDPSIISLVKVGGVTTCVGAQTCAGATCLPLGLFIAQEGTTLIGANSLATVGCTSAGSGCMCCGACCLISAALSSLLACSSGSTRKKYSAWLNKYLCCTQNKDGYNQFNAPSDHIN